jgi:hypothetical protein
MIEAVDTTMRIIGNVFIIGGALVLIGIVGMIALRLFEIIDAEDDPHEQ